MQHIWVIFKRNTHTCERSVLVVLSIPIVIVERDNFKDNFIDTLSTVTQKNSQEGKQIPYGDL